MKDKITIYSKGLVHCSVCADKSLSKKEVEDLVNQENPTGISSQWTVDKDAFADGGANPGQCEDDPKRLHYLMVC